MWQNKTAASSQLIVYIQISKYIHMLDIGHCCSCVIQMCLYNQWIDTS